MRLLGSGGGSLHSRDLRPNETYVFHYPFHTTPCFLINLDHSVAQHYDLRTEDGRQYEWSGGVGPDKAVVAYSAICAHMMTYPARKVSFINYYGESKRFANAKYKQEMRADVIYCCSEKSVYDASRGARVLGGPAEQPLAIIEMQYDGTKDEYFATGTRGGEMFDKFFEQFGYRLTLEYGTQNIRRRVTDSTPLIALAEYCENLIQC